jgi:amidase
MSEDKTGWLVECTIDGLQEALSRGDTTSYAVVMNYLERIYRYDREGPALNSVLEINPDAASIAKSLDYERSQKGPRGRLHGIPILLKDNIDTADRNHTSAGALALKDSFAIEDSYIAAKLREAGAILFGKANMTEWANAMSEWPLMPAGYSSRGGQVRNPYGPGKFGPRGSSSGSAVSVSANLVTVAVGTDTAGSVLSPSHQNSVVGIRPTVGLISRHGIIPVTVSWDTAGPMARTVRDAAILLGALAGVDENDPITQTSAGRAHRDYTAFLNPDGLHDARLGVPRDVFEKAPQEHIELMNHAIEIARGLGATVVDPVELPAARERLSFAPMTYELKPALNAYLSRLRPHVPVHSLTELIAFNNDHSESTLRYGQGGLIAADATSGTLTEPEYLRAQIDDPVCAGEHGIEMALSKHGLNALLMPGPVCSDLAARIGYPSICVPGGHARNGQPLGVTFVGPAYSEPALISFAYAFEQATRVRKPPVLV